MIPYLIRYAESLLGTPYIYGTSNSSGDDPIGGFDCSGFGSELLRAGGLVGPKYRDSAQGIYNLFERNNLGVGRFVPGAFAFYGPSLNKITHIGFLISPDLMIESGGGDASTIDELIAAKQNAFVRLRPVKYRKDFLITLLPPWPGSRI